MNLSPKAKALLAAVLSLLTAAVATLTVVVTTTDKAGVTHTITLNAGAPVRQAPVVDATGRATALAAPPAAVAAAAEGTSGLRSETPSALLSSSLDKAAHDDQLPIVTPDAAPTSTGCLSRFSPNFSSRRGVAPRVITLHETVSPNTPGWGDVNAVGVWLASPRAQASANYILDREAHCLYTVRESDKAWTQANGNPWSISWEIINTASARDRNLIDGAGRAFLVKKLDGISSRWDIPLRRGEVTSDCRIVKAGIVDHYQWGQCGGGHVDVTPFRDEIEPIIHDARVHCQARYHAAHKHAPARCLSKG